MGKKPIHPSVTDWWSQLSGLSQGIAKVGAGVVMLYGAYLWGSDKIVWAEQFEQYVAGNECQFAEINRNTLEGQAADTQFRIGQLSSKKALTGEDARDLAQLNVRLQTIQRRLGALPDCSPRAPASRQQQRR